MKTSAPPATSRGTRMARLTGAVALATVAGLLAAACSSPATSAAGGGSGGTIVLGEPLSPPQIPQQAPYVAQALGFFKKEGVKVKIAYMPNGLTSELGTTSGSITLGMAGGSDSIEAAAQKAPIHAVWVTYQRLDTICIGRVGSIRDLAGKNVGSTGAGGFAATTMNACLQAGGVSPARVHQVTMTRSEFVPALTSGRISAAIFHADDAYTVLHKIKGARILDRQYKSLPGYWYGSLNVKDGYAQAHPAVVERVIAALMMADRWMMNPANNAAFERLAIKSTGESPQAVSYAIRADRALGLWNTSCAVSQQSVSFTSSLLRQQKAITSTPSFSQVYRGSYCAAAAKLAAGQG